MTASQEELPDAFDEVLDEAVLRFEEGGLARAVAYVVQRTEGADDRDRALRAVAKKMVTSDNLTRQEQRDIFLISRENRRKRLCLELGSHATQMIVSARRETSD